MRTTLQPRARSNTLSGGNQQKVLFAKWLFRRPHVFIADEPTRGVDVGAKRAIYELLHSLAAEGIAVLLISSEHEEVLGLAHRVLVMRGGRIVAEFDGRDDERECRAAAPRSGRSKPRKGRSRDRDARARDRGERARGGSATRNLAVIRDYGVVVAFVALFVTLSLESDVFLTWENMKNLAFQTAPVGIIAAGGTLVFIAGGFDLSVGAISGFAAIICRQDLPRHRASGCGDR